MKLKNKQTGEIGLLSATDNAPTMFVDSREYKTYNSLAELCEEWTDYDEEPYIIDMWEDNYLVSAKFGVELSGIERAKECGLYFESKEEAERAVEKIKIYNKLKQKGFVFSGWYYSTEGQLVILADNHEFSETEPKDLTELFGDKIC